MSDDASPASNRSIDATTPLSASLEMTQRSWKQAREHLENASQLPEAAETMTSVEVGQTPAEVVYRENKLELLHYESQTDEQHAPPILVVYALINRPYILDLQLDRSVVRRLLEAGHDVYLIRWGEPSLLDASLGLTDYVDRYIDNCVDCVRSRAGSDDVHLLGYCMGGTMSTMYAARYPEKVRSLGLLAAGLCFDGTGGVLERWGAKEHFDPGRLADVYGTIPASFLSAGFDLMDPVQNTVTKYLTLLDNLDDPDFVENFARMERWLDEGVDVAGNVFAEFVEEVYQSNALIENELDLAGRPVDLDNIEMPVLQIVGTYDHLIPPAASKPFNDAIPSEDSEIIEFASGHVGLSVSSRSHADLWPEVAEWFAERSDPPTDGATGDSGAESDSSMAESVSGSNAGSSDTAGHPRGPEALADTLEGVGPTYAERLTEAGFDTVEAIAGADREALVAATEAPASRVEHWIEQARNR
jgi:polyhydroxyalkanoate synthase